MFSPSKNRTFTTVYFQPRVLLMILLGFSSGLPLALSGSTLTIWMKTVDVDLATIGLFSLVGLPYSLKFFWAPFVDAFSIPILTKTLGRRRSWLVFSQILLILSIIYLGSLDPITTPWLVAFGALIVASISATQDIVIDAYRVEALPDNEQAAGVAYYVSAYRIAMLVSGAGVIAIVVYLKQIGVSVGLAWFYGYCTAAILVLLGILGSVIASEPQSKQENKPSNSSEHSAFKKFYLTALQAFYDFLRKSHVIKILSFVILFKFCDALAGVMTGPFVLDIGFSEIDYATVVKGVGLAATLIGTFLAGFVAYNLNFYNSLWIAALLQMLSNLVFVWLAWIGVQYWALVVAIIIENFTGAIGTIIFIAYLSAVCGNTLHTATQYALLTALASVGRTTLSASSGFIAEESGWILFFILTTLSAIPALILLWLLNKGSHFETLKIETKEV